MKPEEEAPRNICAKEANSFNAAKHYAGLPHHSVLSNLFRVCARERSAHTHCGGACARGGGYQPVAAIITAEGYSGEG